MIKLLIKIAVIVIMVSFQLVNAQEFHGQAVYQSKTKTMNMTMKINGIDANDKQMKDFQEKMDKMNEKVFILTFNKNESVYEEEQKLQAPAPGSGTMMIINSSDEAKTYKNSKEKIILTEKEFFGKEFLLTDALPDWKWELLSETKKIGDYTCYKAQSVKRVTEEEIAEFKENQKKQNDGKTVFFSMSEPKDKTTTVWYTPDIPVSQGPADFWGLPGLILEANFDNTTLLCSKVILNPKNKTEIKKLKKGKKVTKAEYDKIINEQLEQMSDGKGNIKIEINR